MFSHSRTIRLEDTDATGVIFYTAVARICTETLELFLESQNISLFESLHEKKLGIPVVQVQINYFNPLRLGDKVEIQLTLQKKSLRSFTLCFTLFTHKKKAAEAFYTHACVDVERFSSIPLTPILQQALVKIEKA